MATPEEKTALQESFSDWLAGTDSGAFESYRITVIRVRKNEDFDYLYCQRQYHSTGIERGDKFEYAGLYCRRDGQVYDSRYDIRELSDETVRSTEALRETLKQAVRRTVEAAIGNDRANLRTPVVQDKRALEQLAHFQKYTAPGEARKAYLSGEHEDDDFTFTFQCDYTPDNWTEDSLLAYILDPAEYTAAEVVAYMANHQENMLSDFLRADMIAAEYTAILENPLNPIHRVKRIMAAVEASSAKTVTVTVCINDVEFTFKAEARQFCWDCTDHYSDWHIVAANRREFERLFGRNARYGPEDILRIEYARKVIYQAEEVPV